MKAIQGARLADHGRDLVGCFGQHANFVFPEFPWFFRLHHEDPLQNAAVDQRHAQKGVVYLFSRLFEILKTWMFTDILHGNRQHLLRDQAGKALVDGHAEGADAARVKAEGGGQDQVGSIRLQQIGGADVGAEARGDQGNHVHEGIGRLAALLGEVRNLFHGQDVTGISLFVGLGHRDTFVFRFSSECNRARPGEDDLRPGMAGAHP